MSQRPPVFPANSQWPINTLQYAAKLVELVKPIFLVRNLPYRPCNSLLDLLRSVQPRRLCLCLVRGADALQQRQLPFILRDVLRMDFPHVAAVLLHRADSELVYLPDQLLLSRFQSEASPVQLTQDVVRRRQF